MGKIRGCHGLIIQISGRGGGVRGGGMGRRGVGGDEREEGEGYGKECVRYKTLHKWKDRKILFELYIYRI